jgi:hypothetical protein
MLGGIMIIIRESSVYKGKAAIPIIVNFLSGENVIVRYVKFTVNETIIETGTPQLVVLERDRLHLRSRTSEVGIAFADVEGAKISDSNNLSLTIYMKNRAYVDIFKR